MLSENRRRGGPDLDTDCAGIVVVLAAVIIRVVSINRYSAVEAAPSLATQIEDLERQYREGLISTEEFDAKRARLLDQL